MATKGTTRRTGAKAARGKPGAPLKNYRSSADVSDIFETIRRSLAEGGARRISFDYDQEGRACEISFALTIGEQLMTFRLPARLHNVEPLVAESYRTIGTNLRGEALREQAYKTGWANIRDWVAAQIALIRTDMVKAHEVFLPYLLNEQGQTYFEAFDHQLALPGPAASRTIIREE